MGEELGLAAAIPFFCTFQWARSAERGEQGTAARSSKRRLSEARRTISPITGSDERTCGTPPGLGGSGREGRDARRLGLVRGCSPCGHEPRGPAARRSRLRGRACQGERSARRPWLDRRTDDDSRDARTNLSDAGGRRAPADTAAARRYWGWMHAATLPPWSVSGAFAATRRRPPGRARP